MVIGALRLIGLAIDVHLVHCDVNQNSGWGWGFTIIVRYM